MMRILSLGFVLLVCLTLSADTVPAQAQYRAFWLDTFNTALNTQSDVVTAINQIKSANCNAIFAQVRRRGDAWYLNSLEPKPDFVSLAPNFDPLAALIAEAHAQGIEVHAFVILGAAWNKTPTLPVSSTGGPPSNPNHVFNLHGNFNAQTGAIDGGPNNWLTRTLLPDQSGVIAFGGYRFGAEFWLDFGHPEAAAYTVETLLHLVRNYDLDGLHLDRVRYPELNVSGQTPSTGANIGYNETSVARFLRFNGQPPDAPPPAQNDAAWVQWRRDQVTNMVRRIYLGAIAAKPNIKVSGALIAFGNGPTTEASWTSAEAYWRVYQDWRAWTEEGILDLALPMVYKTEHTTSGATALDQWAEWTRNHQYNRAALLGAGPLVNAIEGNLRQTRRALQPSTTTGNRVAGVIFYSQATSNVAVTANPYSFPAGQNTPVRPFAEFAAGLKTGRSADGLTQYEDTAANPIGIFANPAPVPALSWKTMPQAGYLQGFIVNDDGAAVDSGQVVLTRMSGPTPPAGTRTTVTTRTDGQGFYGGVDLAPGTYRLMVTPLGQAAFTPPADVTVATGQVTRSDVAINRTSAARLQLTPPDAPLIENVPVVNLIVTRTGDLTQAVTIDYAITDGTAQQRTDYTIGSGTLRFAAGESVQRVPLLLVDDNYDEAHETLTLTLSNPQGATLAGPPSATLTIYDNDNNAPVGNPSDAAQFFVRQHYLDFLSRAPDMAGLDYWTGQITVCGTDAACIHRRRRDVSAAFFIELEFQETGAFVYRLYKAAFGEAVGYRPDYTQFMPDRARVVGGATVAQGKLDFATAFATRPAFVARYPASLSAAQFVDAVLQTVQQGAGVTFTTAQRDAFIINVNTDGRGLFLRNLADNQAFTQAVYNRAFVLMQYFGYLRRDPDQGGYDFWVDVVTNREPGNYRGMVCAFITAAEYQQRFSSVVTRSNNDCNIQ